MGGGEEPAYNLIGRFYKTNGEFKKITSKELEAIKNSSETTISIRSPILCQSQEGICQTCYGWDLSTKEIAEKRTPVGIIASQSIGERTTQLSLSARHRVEIKNDLEEVIHFFDGKSEEIQQACEKLKKGVPFEVVGAELLGYIFSKFRGDVDIKHFEVVLRLMLQQAFADGKTIWGLKESMLNRPGWLSNLAFDRPFSVLRKAALEQAVDSLEGLLENLLVSRYRFESKEQQ